MGYLDAAMAVHSRLFPLDAAQVIPCTPAEISQLEKQVGMKLPAAYREFLSWMGKYGGDFWVGHAAFYGELIEINQWARDLVQSSRGLMRLPPNAFVFFWNVAQSFYFFEVAEDDDPAVYFFMDTNLEEVIRRTADPAKLSPGQSYLRYLWEKSPRDRFVSRAKRFSDCLASEIEEHARVRMATGVWK